jgi:hypothetical protein
MGAQTTEIRFADVADLQKAEAESWYFIAGTGGNLQDWVNGYEDLMEEQGIGKPKLWFQTNGATVNAVARAKRGFEVAANDQFKGDLTCLLFPLEGLNAGKLAMFKLRMNDRWFDDVVANMRRA